MRRAKRAESKKRKGIDWRRLGPPGVHVKRLVVWWLVLMVIGTAWSGTALVRLIDGWRETEALLEIQADVRMRPFSEIIRGNSAVFMLAGCYLFGVIGANYASLTAGSRADYTMRRLPNRWEYHARCLAVPAVCLAITALAALGLRHLWWVMYLRLTPAEALSDVAIITVRRV